MSWFDQLSLWDESPKGEEKWRIAARQRGEKYAVAVLWQHNHDRLTQRHGVINSEFYANDLAMEINSFQLPALFRVECGGDSLDNPCMSIVWTNDKGLADFVVDVVCGKGMTELMEV